MENYRYSIIIRCSDDFRVFNLLSQIDASIYQVVVSITPNSEIEKKLSELGLQYVVSKKGNTALTTNLALPFVLCDNVLLLDSDCSLYPDTLNRYSETVINIAPDFIKPYIEFEAKGISSYLTKLQRTFQYNAFDFIYEPCLLVNLKKVLPKIGGYLFSDFALFTPDGELDFRVKQSGLEFLIVKDNLFSIKHLALSYTKNIKSHWRYGMSEANILKHTGHNVIKSFFKDVASRYKKALSLKSPILTTPCVFVCDIIYIFSFFYHYQTQKNERS